MVKTFLSCLLISFTFSLEANYFVWSKGFMLSADVKPESLFQAELPLHLYQEIKRGDVVWIRTSWLDDFVKEILPEIHEPFVLVTGDSDESIPYHREQSTDILLNHPLVQKWFTQNLDVEGKKHPKLEYLPIGMDFHTLQKNPETFMEKRHVSAEAQEEALFELFSRLKPTNQRIVKVHYDAHLVESTIPLFSHRYGYSRTHVMEILRKKGSNVVYIQPERIPQHRYFEKKGEYAFSVCMFGAGLDTHRTWENLALGHIVIMKSTQIDPLFQGLPVIIIKSFDEIHEKNLQKWLKQYGDVFHNQEMRVKLTHNYWMNRINKAKAECF